MEQSVIFGDLFRFFMTSGTNQLTVSNFRSALEILIKIKPEKALKLNSLEKVILLRFI